MSCSDYSRFSHKALSPQLLGAWRYDPHAPENVAYYGVPLETKLEYGGAYLALAALLAVMTCDVHEMLGSMMRPR
ncbi:hypothetical protein [Bradyrhizobium sp. 145]|uniref:hypothetical protein n=1 Tax=Bradyrhizobium sp. 145 TaxID=2782621 RepID=UPI001FF8ABE7|nr:hypothetical protein [Bradyrhizobium sp. 145]